MPTNLQMQNLSTLALSKMISISQISIIRVHFDTMLLGNIDQFLTSYKMTANENTQIIMYNGTTNDTTLYFNISGVISDGNQAQLLSADLASLQGSLDETAVLQTFTTTTIASVPKYQKFVLKSGYGIKLSVFDPNNIGDYIDLDISITKNPDKTPVEIKPYLEILKNSNFNNDKKKSSLIWIFLIIIIILAVVGVVYYYKTTKRATVALPLRFL